MPCPTSVELEEVLCLYFFIYTLRRRSHRGGELSEGLRGSFSLNHNFLTIHDVYSLGGVEHAATHQIVDEF